MNSNQKLQVVDQMYTEHEPAGKVFNISNGQPVEGQVSDLDAILDSLPNGDADNDEAEAEEEDGEEEGVSGKTQDQPENKKNAQCVEQSFSTNDNTKSKSNVIKSSSALDMFNTVVTDEDEDAIWRGGFFRRGHSMLIGGEPKVGKTAFIMSFALHAALGRDFLGHSFKKPMKVYWLQAEIGQNDMRRRIQSAVKGMNIDSSELHLIANLDISDKTLLKLNATKNCKNFAGLLQKVEAHEADIVMVDPLINFSPVEETDQNKMLDWLNSLAPLKGDGQRGLVITHHTVKNAFNVLHKQKNTVSSLLRSASSIGGYYDSLAVLINRPDRRSKEVHYDNRHITAPESSALSFDGDSFTWSVGKALDGSAPKAKSVLTGSKLETLRLLFSIGSVTKQSDFIEKMESAIKPDKKKRGGRTFVSSATAYRYVEHLIKENFIRESVDADLNSVIQLTPNGFAQIDSHNAKVGNKNVK